MRRRSAPPRAPGPAPRTACGPAAPTGARLARALAIALGLAAALAPAAADEPRKGPPVIYKWVDADGIAHYTADPRRVPANVRSMIHEGGAARTQPPTGAQRRAPSEVWVELDAPPLVEDGSEGALPDSPALIEQRAALDEQIAALATEIAKDEAAVRDLLSQPLADGADEVPPGLRELAARLPALQAELRALKEQRARLEAR